ncbi:MAG: hypothetical protein R2849_23275 [Thermomicrobiales bacterium]
MMADLNGDFELDDQDIDSGEMDAGFLVGGPVESGLVMGQGTLTGEHGTLEFHLAVDRYGPHGIAQSHLPRRHRRLRRASPAQPA